MTVDIFFQRTSEPGVFFVLRKGFRIGKVMYMSGIDQWIFKHSAIDELLFVGDSRESAVSIYYLNFGGTKNGRMECVRFPEKCNI